MNAYKADCGVTYWIAAPNLVEAMQALAACWVAEGADDDAEHVTIDEVPTGKLAEIHIRDDGSDATVPLDELVAKSETAAVVACSEWP